MRQALVPLALLACVAAAIQGCAESGTPMTDTGLEADGSPVADGGDGDDSCEDAPCEPGESQCAGPGSVVHCVEDDDGCGIYQTPNSCPGDETCTDGRCGDGGDGCVDNDNDGYGQHCAQGMDCDDSDRNIHPGANEICDDSTDNDCDGEIDEDCEDPCAGQSCNPGQMRCSGDQVEVCEPGVDGCGSWEGPKDCPSGRCENGACADCIDNDGDGYGDNCPAGLDCDDNDGAVHPGAEELCDNEDNDCDNDVDEAFADRGSSCAVGKGVCRKTGTVVCASNQRQTTCDATAGSGGDELCGDNKDNDCDGDTDEGFGIVGQSCTRGSGDCQTRGRFACDPNDPTATYCDAPDPSTGGSREICDGDDNDCDGSTDENNVCSTCVEDSYEPNDSSGNGTDLTSSKTVDELNSCGPCGGGSPYDVDWFALGSHPASTSITLELSHLTGTNAAGDEYADLDIEFFCGSKFCDAIRGQSGTTSGTLSGTCYDGSTCGDNTPWTIKVYPRCNLNPNGNPPSGTPYQVTRQ